MSSSNSLAAARRRRAQSNQPIQQQQHLIQQPMQNMPPPAHQDQLTDASHYQGQMQNTTKASTPMQLLTQHDMRIFSMEQNMQNILSQLDDTHQDSGSDLKLQDALSTVNGRLSILETKTKGNGTENLAYFKEKYINIEKQLGDLKKLLIKVQTFAMETNLAFIKYKNHREPTLENIISKNETQYKKQIAESDLTNHTDLSIVQDDDDTLDLDAVASSLVDDTTIGDMENSVMANEGFDDEMTDGINDTSELNFEG